MIEKGPIIDIRQRRELDEYLDQQLGALKGETDPEVLANNLESQIQSGDDIGAAVTMLRLAQLGETERMLELTGKSRNASGLIAASEDVAGMRVNKKISRHVLRRASNFAKNNLQFAYAEITGSRDEIRAHDERQRKLYDRASEAGADKVFTQGDHRAVGGYDAGGNWQPEPAMIGFLAQAMPSLLIKAQRGLLNDDLGMHIFTNPIIEKQLREMIIIIHGPENESEATQMAFKAMDAWKVGTPEQPQRKPEEILAIASQVMAKYKK